MKPRRFIKAVNHAANFVDLFGDNLGGPKLSEMISLSCDRESVTIKNMYGTEKTFLKEQTSAICDEIANCLESFKPNYPGYIRVNTELNGNKIVFRIASCIFLDGTRSIRYKVGIITISGRDISIRFEVTETFTEHLS